jgi:hypothetical protein
MPLSDPFDLGVLRGPQMDLDALRRRPSRKPPRHQQGEAFLKGPIPWRWLSQAGRLPGKALHVALMLWKQAGCQKNRTVRFRLANAAELGIHRGAARRGLRALAEAGLVTICYSVGKALEVTINEASATPSTEGA